MREHYFHSPRGSTSPCIFLMLFWITLGILSCTEISTEPAVKSDATKILIIRTDSTLFTWTGSDINDRYFTLIFATLINTSTDTLYTRLSDMYQPPERNELFIVEHSDGFIEKLVGDHWVEKERAVASEGVYDIELAPSKIYTLTAFTSWPDPELGTFRIKVFYYRQKDSVQTANPLI
ncbi:MAG TPA: hypothetical protein VGB10_02705, partial [Bacteroidota bacterium]